MPNVYIDSLTLENFGPYYGEHTFNFSPLDDRCGIVIGGKNGAGKTHLLQRFISQLSARPAFLI